MTLAAQFCVIGRYSIHRTFYKATISRALGDSRIIVPRFPHYILKTLTNWLSSFSLESKKLIMHILKECDAKIIPKVVA